MPRPPSPATGHRRWLGFTLPLNIGLLLLTLGLSACEPEPDAPALRGAAVEEERHATAPASTDDYTPRHAVCEQWVLPEVCDSAIATVIDFFSDLTFDWRRFSGNPGKLRELQEDHNDKVLARLSDEYVLEVSRLLDLGMATFDQAVAAGLFGVRGDIFLDVVEPVGQSTWTPNRAHVRVSARSEFETLAGDTVCRIETARITMRRGGSDDPWLFDRGFLFPMSSQTVVGPCE